MQLFVTLALIVCSALLGALLGVLLAGPWGAVAGVIPPTVVAIWQAWRGHQQGKAVRAWIDAREDEERDRLLRALGSGDMRLPH